MNIIIGKINDQKADEALELIAKLMTQFPTENALYYYRGRANLAAKKMPEAKADLEKFVAAAPADRARAARREEDPRADEGHQVRAALWALLLALPSRRVAEMTAGHLRHLLPRTGSLRRVGVRKPSKPKLRPTAPPPPPSAARSIRPRGGASSNHSGSTSRRPNAAARSRPSGPSRPLRPTSATSPCSSDEGDLILPPNTFDLKGLGLRFTRNSPGRLRRPPASTPRSGPPSATRITLTDDDSAASDVPFLSVLRRTSGPRVRQLRRQHHVSRGRTTPAPTATSAAC